jgi:membrane associated rhomboid family serine protease
MRLPVSAAGKKAKCPACEAVFRVPVAAAVNAGPAAATLDVTARLPLKLRCPQCAAKLKLPAEAAGRRVKCPKCAKVLRIPAAAPPSPTAAAGLGEDDLLSELAAAEKMTPAATSDILAIAPPELLTGETTRPSTTLQAGTKVGTRTCPGCKKMLPADAKICVDCGIYLKTGRTILMTEDQHVDRAYAVAESTIRWVSWIIWFGIYPIASEAFGLRKPWVVRGIAILTIAASFAFFAAMIAGGPAERTFDGLMLWAGDPEVGKALLDGLPTDDGEPIRDPNAAATHAALREYLASAREFHPIQLLTHTFLHAGLLHLAGNMLFLMVLGARVNALIGNIWTLALYPVLAVVAGVAHMLSVADALPTAALGASGAIMGLAGMYLVLFPLHRVHMAIWLRWGIVLPLRLSAKLFAVRGFWVVLFYIAFDVIYTVFRLEDEVAHWAHLGGFIAGAAIALALLLGRRIDARGGDLLSAILGRHAWKLIGRPRPVASHSSPG